MWWYDRACGAWAGQGHAAGLGQGHACGTPSEDDVAGRSVAKRKRRAGLSKGYLSAFLPGMRERQSVRVPVAVFGLVA